MTYHGFLLDADNTLFDFDRAQREALMETVGRTDRLLLRAFRKINDQLWRRAEKGEITVQELKTERFRLLAADQKCDIQENEASEEFLCRLAEKPYLYRGAARVLDALSRRAVLGLLTNGLSAVQRPRIVRAEIEVFFQGIFVSEELGLAKPDPAIFHHAARELHVPIHEILCVGDSPQADIAGAQSAGMASCWYNPKGRSWDSRLPSPDLTIQSLEALLSFAPPLN